MPPRATALADPDQAETNPQPRASTEALRRIHGLVASINKIRAANTPWTVAGGCATVLAKTLDARAVVIHRYDASVRELRIIGIEGASSDGLLGSVSNADDDFVAMNVLAGEQTMTVRIDGALPELAPLRLRALGASRSVVALPVMSGAACVALVELVDVEERSESIVADVCELLSDQLRRVLTQAS